MLGLMQDSPLLISSILTFAARHHPKAEIVSSGADGTLHRYTYAEAERRARRLARVLGELGIGEGDRVATIAWNGYRHFELYFAVPGIGAICHTINPRLAQDDVAYMIEHAGDRIVFAETEFAPLVESVLAKGRGKVEVVVLLGAEAGMRRPRLPAAVALHAYETLMAAASEDYAWPNFDENTASALCYTSGTTGRPKGVLYSNRSTVLHAYAINGADVFGFRAVDRVMPAVAMFHANGWGIPHAAAMVGAAQILPGRELDGASLLKLMNAECVTFTAGVPTIWLGLLNHLRSSGTKLNTLRRLVVGGAACPQLLVEAFESEYGVRVDPAWGMTELSPLAGYNQRAPATAALPPADMIRHRLKQGRCPFGIDMKIVDENGEDLPWDGKAFGNLMMRGPWVASAYFNSAEPSPVGADSWFPTGDVSTIDADGYVEIVDRSKDLIKSGGEWISSIALENIAVSHPDVLEAAIIAAEHPKWGERPLLLVAMKEGRKLDRPGVLTLYKGTVADWWLPDDVVAVDSLPHTATGKLNKVVLRKEFRGHLLERAKP